MSTQANQFTVSEVAPAGAAVTPAADNPGARTPGSNPSATSVPPQQDPKGETGAPPKQEEKKDFLAPRFAALTKKERALQAQRNEIKSLEARIQAREAKLSAWEAAKSAATKDPIGFLEKELGITYDHLTQTVLNDKRPPAELAAMAAQREVEKLRREQEEKQRQEQEEEEQRANEEAQRTYNEFVASTHDFVKSNTEAYELVNLFEAQQYVVDVITQYHQKTGRILSQKEAADFTEKWYEDRLEKAKTLKKFQAKATTQPQSKESEQRTPSAQPRTMDNTFTPTTASAAPAPTEGPLPYEVRVQRALAKMDAVMKGQT